VHEIEGLLGRQAIDGLDLEALEMAVRQQALQLAARAVEQRLNADTSDNAGPRLPCGCGGEARYAGRRSKRFQSALGSLHLQRAYYHCGACGRGFCPRDRSLAQLSQLRAFSVEIWGGPCDKFCIFNVGCAQGFVV
jgi:hypothetical protein